MEEYIKVKDLIDMLEQRLVFQEQYGFYRDASYTSRFIESIADIPRADVIEKSEYDNFKWQFDEIDYECDRLEEVNDKLERQLVQAEAEIAKKIFDDLGNIFREYFDAHTNKNLDFDFEKMCKQAARFTTNELWHSVGTLKKKYKVEE